MVDSVVDDDGSFRFGVVLALGREGGAGGGRDPNFNMAAIGARGLMDGRVMCLPVSAVQQIIYANPCKPPAHIRYARDRGVHLMTFDNEDELHKVRGRPVAPH